MITDQTMFSMLTKRRSRGTALDLSSKTKSFSQGVSTSSPSDFFVQCTSNSIQSPILRSLVSTSNLHVGLDTDAGALITTISPVCTGSGTDASSDGLIASVIVPSLIGLSIWLLFAVLRPQFRQFYALREWFVDQDRRPKPLSSSLFAFLHPPVPLVPSVPTDISDTGKSPAGDAALFPADEQLLQRVLWTALVIVLGWAFLGLAGALPLHMVSTSYVADFPNTAMFDGAFINEVEIIKGMTKEDIWWDVLQNERRPLDSVVLSCLLGLVVFLLAAGLTAAAGLALTTSPAVAHYLPFLAPLFVFISLAVALIEFSVHVRSSVSVSGTQLFLFQTMFYVLVGTAIWLIKVGVASGAIYMVILALSVVVTCAIIFPGLLLLQPTRLWNVLRAEKSAVTPRQRAAVHSRAYDPAFALGACILAIIFASTFSMIFPLVAPAIVILVFLSFVAHRFLTGGLLQIWLLRHFGKLFSLQPILLGLIFLSREFWIEGGVRCDTGIFVVIFVEIYVITKTRQPGRGSLSQITRDSLDAFRRTMRPTSAKRRTVDDESTSLVSSARVGHHPRGSMASVLEIVSVPLSIHCFILVAPRAHPDAPPHLPQLSFTDHVREMASILYAPELIAPPPIIWLPNDAADVARSEVFDLQKYHDLRVTLDVRSKNDILTPLQRSVKAADTNTLQFLILLRM
ncbi:hypothetical protein DFH08DRAFT_956621 [Mycena albidolilacea]|uniref:CSC1/OSCA1-like 7TM region domain-containing protein n=1 Tax=Mycena albidolilacea TaxID=1033008 RepID=A0AAD7AAS1_9AGAR|nr:hypothetical protein DFH08DRAFT_956621 [Mycena albidolilacea]